LRESKKTYVVTESQYKNLLEGSTEEDSIEDSKRFYKMFKRIIDDKFSELTYDESPRWSTHEDDVAWKDSDEDVFRYNDYTFLVKRGFFWSLMNYLPISHNATKMMFERYFKASSLIFQSAKLFGVGVILSTAFNHMLVESFENLHNPCVGEAILSFAALPGVCSLFGVFLTLLIQVIASEVLSGLAKKNSGFDSPLKSSGQKDPSLESASTRCKTTENTIEIGSSSIQDDSCIGTSHMSNNDSGHNHSHGGIISHSTNISAYLLEFGVASHSIIIGIALGIATEEFQSLFIAIVFHQFFEGIGLSSVITEAEFKKKQMALGMIIFCISKD
jgi:zinc transporter ZupT